MAAMATVLITGASRGIGRATAARLAAAGWDVVAGVRSTDDGEALTAELGARVTPVQLDVAEPADIEALASELPERLDAVVNNAGFVVDGPVETVTPDALRRQFDVNVVGQVAVTQALLPRLRASRGRIVFMSSLSGRISTPMTGAYSASKFALEAIADALRVELRPWKIAVILVEPGATDTDIWRGALDTYERTQAAMTAEQRELYAHHLAGTRKLLAQMQKRAVPVEDVAATVERALTASRPRARYPVGLANRAQLAAAAALPTPVFDAAMARVAGAR
jgi:NAD(P)-dependent dehydrogenase (short-subunit alcohol dehydrogenase family)